MEALEGFTEIRKHSAEVKIVRYLYTDFNLAISYICSVDTSNHFVTYLKRAAIHLVWDRRLMFWSMASGDQNMIGAWACLGFRDLSNDVEDMTYFEDKNCICIIYHHPNPGLELRTVPDGLILHRTAFSIQAVFSKCFQRYFAISLNFPQLWKFIGKFVLFNFL